MKDEDRGKIRNREWAARLRDFSGLRFGKITPTDIDGFMDFNNKVFVYIETKRGNAKLPYGQKLAYERLCDCTDETGRRGLVVVASYIDDKNDIAVAGLPVTLIRMDKKWRKPHRNLTVRQAIEDYLAWCHLKGAR